MMHYYWVARHTSKKKDSYTCRYNIGELYIGDIYLYALLYIHTDSSTYICV